MALKALGPLVALGPQWAPDVLGPLEVPGVAFCAGIPGNPWDPGGPGDPRNPGFPVSPARPWTSVALLALGVMCLLETPGPLGVLVSQKCTTYLS